MNIKLAKIFRDLLRLGKLETEEGILIYEGDVLTEGTEVFIEDESGNIIPAPDGKYGNYTVKDGKIAPEEGAADPDEAEPEAEPVEQAEPESEPEPAAEPEAEPEKEEEPKEDEYEKRFEALEKELEDLKAAIAELQKERDDMEFSALKPAEKEIKDITTSQKKGALRFFE